MSKQYHTEKLTEFKDIETANKRSILQKFWLLNRSSSVNTDDTPGELFSTLQNWLRLAGHKSEVPVKVNKHRFWIHLKKYLIAVFKNKSSNKRQI
jgi:hypothetical protein